MPKEALENLLVLVVPRNKISLQDMVILSNSREGDFRNMSVLRWLHLGEKKKKKLCQCLTMWGFKIVLFPVFKVTLEPSTLELSHILKAKQNLLKQLLPTKHRLSPSCKKWAAPCGETSQEPGGTLVWVGPTPTVCSPTASACSGAEWIAGTGSTSSPRQGKGMDHTRAGG